MNIVSVDQLLTELGPGERPWLIDGLIQAKSIGFVAGESKCFKSWLTLHMAMAAATGSKFLDHFRVAKPVKVLMVQEEDAHETVIKRYRLLQAGMNMPEPGRSMLNFAIQTGLKLDDTKKLEQFFDQLNTVRPDLIIFDVLNKLHNGSEDQRGATAVMSAVETIRRNFSTACLVVHHFAKGGNSNKRGNQRMRGSSVFSGWSENSLYVTRPSETSTEIDVEVESKFAQAQPFSYKIESLEAGVKLSYFEREDVETRYRPTGRGLAMLRRIHRRGRR